MPAPTKPTRIRVSGDPSPITRLPTTYEQERGTNKDDVINAIFIVVAALVTLVLVWVVLVVVFASA